jgi:hypothetical protein
MCTFLKIEGKSHFYDSRIAYFSAIWRILAGFGKSGNLPDAKFTVSNGWRANKAQIQPAKGDKKCLPIVFSIC